jgi:metal-responsive CopG/Arc/MetJ family transcriptional regulator
VFDEAMITYDDITMRTIVDLPQEQVRKLALVCRREKISRAEAVRRALDRFLRSSSVRDLRSFFGASKTRGNVSRQVARLRREWSGRN